MVLLYDIINRVNTESGMLNETHIKVVNRILFWCGNPFRKLKREPSIPMAN